MDKEHLIKNFLSNFSEINNQKRRSENLDVWNFSDDKSVSDRLISLVKKGIKTATSGLLSQHKSVPRVGDWGIITDEKGNPVCLIEYTQIEIKPFLDVGLDFALDEGEGFKNLNEWRKKHRQVFLKWTDGEFSDKDIIVCERFKLIY